MNPDAVKAYIFSKVLEPLTRPRLELCEVTHDLISQAFPGFKLSGMVALAHALSPDPRPVLLEDQTSQQQLEAWAKENGCAVSYDDRRHVVRFTRLERVG